MLSKSATMLLGLITHQPLNAYEIVKALDYMNIKYWFNIGTSTVYATIKTLEKKQYITGEVQKDGNMPDKTVYSITEQGKNAFLETLRSSFLKFDYDTNIFSITAFFLDCLPEEEQKLYWKCAWLFYKNIFPVFKTRYRRMGKTGQSISCSQSPSYDGYCISRNQRNRAAFKIFKRKIVSEYYRKMGINAFLPFFNKPIEYS